MEILSVSAVIDLADSETILPGMIDLHAHYNFDLVDAGRVEEVVYNGIIFLANGVTSTWSAGEYYPERVIARRDLIDAGEATGPRLFASGPYFGAFRCEYSIKTADDDCVAWPNDITDDEIRHEVDNWAEQGVISIKIKQASPDEDAHYNFDLVDAGRVEEVVYNGIIFLANGVTSTWSAGEYYPERVIARRDLIDAGEATGPRLFASGPYFGAFRCEYSIKTADDDCVAWPNDITDDEIRHEVDKWAEQGVISIKIKQASPDEAKILIEQAHKNGMTTTGHRSRAFRQDVPGAG